MSLFVQESRSIHGKIKFTDEQQFQFSELSGDYNPIHIDRKESRKSSFGELIVHGIHLLLLSISKSEITNRQIRKIKCNFKLPAKVNQDIDFLIDVDVNEINTSYKINGEELTSISLKLSSDEIKFPKLKNGVPPKKPCLNLDLNLPENQQGKLSLLIDKELSIKMFGSKIVVNNTAYQFAVLLASTRLVGMICPGLYSVYNFLEIEFFDSISDQQDEGIFNWKILRYKEVYGILDIEVWGSYFKGKICCFKRPTPVNQPSLVELSKTVSIAEKKSKALIIGGSRGIGEVCAKLHTLAETEVLITYKFGRDEAKAIASEAEAFGKKILFDKFDVDSSDSLLDLLTRNNFIPDYVYYFATPPVHAQNTKSIDISLINKYLNFYITNFIRVLDQLNDLPITDHYIKVFYPSSVFVFDCNNKFKEYALTKFLGESLCDYLNNFYENMEFIVQRLPIVDTDLTNSILKQKTSNIVEVVKGFLF